MVSEAARNLLVERARAWSGFGVQAQDIGFIIERMGAGPAQALTRNILAQTPQSLARVAARYLRPNKRVETVLSPRPTRPAVNGLVASSRAIAKLPGLDLPGLLKPANNRPWQWRESGRSDDVHRFDFDSGLTLLVRHTPSNPLLSAAVHVRGGQWVEDPSKAGIAVLTSQLLTSGTRHFTGLEWTRLLSRHSLSYSTVQPRRGVRSDVDRNVYARDGTNLRMEGVQEQWRLVLALMGEALFRPVFPELSVINRKHDQITEIETLFEDNLEYIKQEFYPLAFAGHPYGRPTIGTRKTVSTIKREHIVKFHALNFRPSRVVLAISANVDPKRIADFIAVHWSDVSTRPAPRLRTAELKTPPKVKRRRILDLNRKQRCINYGAPTLSIRDQRFLVAQVLFGVVQGRHFFKYVYDRGVSYRAWFKLWPQRGPSAWIMENDVATKGFEKTLKGMEQDLREYAQGRFTTKQVIMVRKNMMLDTILEAQDPSIMAFELALNEGLGAGYERVTQRVRLLGRVTRDAVNRLARRIFGNGGIYRLQFR